MAKLPVEDITRDHVKAAISQLDEGVEHSFGPSVVYDVLYEGKRYPPKAVVGLAGKLVSGIDYGPHDFKGGEGAGVTNDLLKRLDFEVVRKYDCPTKIELLNPLLRAMHSLGGSGTVEAIDNKVIELEEYPDHVRNQLHNSETSNSMTQLSYDLAWARTYLKNAKLLENPNRAVWTLTPYGEGVHEVDPQEIQAAMRNTKRVGEGLTENAVDRWRGYWDKACEDSDMMDKYRRRNQAREKIIPDIQQLLENFLHSEIDLTRFREDFHLKTLAKGDWDLFGLKGHSGAQFLNMLVKYLPNQAETAGVLRKALTLPDDLDDAKQKIENFKNFLELRIEEGAATRKQLSPGRTAFLLSAFWHMKQKDQWPIFYFSSRRALKEDGLLGDGWAEYFAFAPVYVELAERLGISLWELTQLCVTINDQSDASDVDDGEVQPLGGITEGTGVWLIALGEKGVKFDECFDEGIIAIGWDYLGDLTEYPDRTAISEAIQKYRGNDVSPMNDSLACHQFANEMEVDDVVFAKRGRKEIMGYGVVTSEYRYEPDRGDYSNVRSVDWKSRGSWPRDNDLVNKTLTEISRYKKLVAGIQKDLGLIDPVIGPIERPPSAYGFDDALRDLFIPRADIETALSLLRYKKNLVLQGPPGTGKTFIAKRLAWLLLGEKDDDRIEQVQFHQSYSYEDFVQGYRPTDDGKFSRADGLFMRFCDKALQDDQSHYVLIIDEINRGNLSKIFGELLMLLEADKRSISWATTMTYAKEDEPRFYIPSNLHLIGTMNTADQSLAMVDYALRRRFAFRDVQPAFREPAFDRALDEMGASQDLKFKIIERMERLNRRLSDDDNLGEGFRIGHSYFCQTGEGSADEAWYGRVIESEIEPLLREYWKDNRERSDTEVKELLED